MLLQERLVGPGVGVFACYHDGRPVALFSHRRLRERPPWGGVSVLCESAEVDPVAGEHATRLLDGIGWQGVAMVEFKRDLRDGVPKLMEINGRFWGSLQLAIDAGRELSGAADADDHRRAVRAAAALSRGHPRTLALGRRGRAAGHAAAGPECSASGGSQPPARDRATSWSSAADLHYDNPKWDDRAPFVAETRSWFRKLAAGAARASVPVATLMGASPVALVPAEAPLHRRASATLAVPPVPSAAISDAPERLVIRRGRSRPGGLERAGRLR